MICCLIKTFTSFQLLDKLARCHQLGHSKTSQAARQRKRKHDLMKQLNRMILAKMKLVITSHIFIK